MREKLLNLVESLGENWPIPCSNSLEGERPFVVVEPAIDFRPVVSRTIGRAGRNGIRPTFRCHQNVNSDSSFTRGAESQSGENLPLVRSRTLVHALPSDDNNGRKSRSVPVSLAAKGLQPTFSTIDGTWTLRGASEVRWKFSMDLSILPYRWE